MHTQSEFKLGKTSEIYPFLSDESIIHHRQEAYFVFFSGDEKVTIFLNKRPIEIADNTLVFVSPNCFVGLDEKEPEMDVLYFTSTFYNRSLHDSQFLLNSPLFPSGSYFSYRVPRPFRSYVDFILGMMQEAFQRIAQPLYSNLIHNLLEQMLIQCTLHGTQGKSMVFMDNADHVLTSLFKDYVTKDVRKSRTVKYYADKLNITTRRLSNATRNVLGKTPKDVIIDFVIAQFKWQLLYTDVSIKEIGREYGFLDENNFSSFFAKEVGVTPKEFRRKSTIGQS